ncbi:MAG: ATP-binding cassette domain-containing protein [Longimicrobiales bacterium]
MIKLINVTRVFRGKTTALDDVSFHILKGEVAFLTGHSGSGKTTALRLIHMADRPTSGEVRVSGFSSDRTSSREVWTVRRRPGNIFQDFRLLPGRTALENVAFALEVTGARSTEIKPRAQRLLTQVGLASKASSMVHELSGGEQQRVAVARALANDPLVLLADEPTGNLDDRATRGIMELFWEVNALGMAVLMATHDLELVRSHGKARVLELDHGQLVYDSVKTEAASSGETGEAQTSSTGL